LNEKQVPRDGNGLMRNTPRVQLGIVSITMRALSLSAFIGGGLFASPLALGEQGDKALNSYGEAVQSIYDEKTRIPSVEEGRLVLPIISALTTNTSEIGNGSTPKEFREDSSAPVNDLPESGYDRDQQWGPSQYQFTAANTFSHPRYFEDRMLERHGYERFPYLQPFVGGARFFTTVPMLPYLMTIQNPCEIESQLGYFRPGSAVAPYIQRPPYQRDAVVVEAAAVAGGFIAIP
jgi:hypothetical protein